jgi:hypothetical protein
MPTVHVAATAVALSLLNSAAATNTSIAAAARVHLNVVAVIVNRRPYSPEARAPSAGCLVVLKHQRVTHARRTRHAAA